jgi:integrase
MVGLTRSKSGYWVARKAIPADVRDAYFKLYKIRREAILKLPAGTSKHEAKTRLAEWVAQVETRISSLRASQRGEGQPLTAINAHALAGLWYHWFVGQHENDLGTPKRWREMTDHLVWNVLYAEAPDEYHERPGADPTWEWAKEPEVRDAVRPQVAEMARVATFLANEGIALDAHAYALFVDAVSDNLLLALALLERRALGDYSPDTTTESFPAFADSSARRAQGLSCWDLFSAYVQTVKPAEGTVQRWRAVFLDIQNEFPDTAATAISEADARAWIRRLASPERSPSTIREVWLPAARRVFGWGVENNHVQRNPFSGIKVDVPKRIQSRETKAFSPDEVRLILTATLFYSEPKTSRDRARRWVLWLCAYSGARAGEITQLRGSDVEQRGELYVMRLTPEAGTIKTGQARVVPIHEHLVHQGFLEMVRKVGSGPLFYNALVKPIGDGDQLKPPRSRAAARRAQISSWVRELGVTDPEVSPTHGWRHTFKQTADRAGIIEKVHDAITGHAARTEGSKYGQPTVADMGAALKKFPRYDID